MSKCWLLVVNGVISDIEAAPRWLSAQIFQGFLLTDLHNPNAVRFTRGLAALCSTFCYTYL